MRDNPTFSMVNESDDESEAMLLPKSGENDHGAAGQSLRLVGLDQDDDSDD
jgi:hypothetical protein